jgi:hypothetical protein
MSSSSSYSSSDSDDDSSSAAAASVDSAKLRAVREHLAKNNVAMLASRGASSRSLLGDVTQSASNLVGLPNLYLSNCKVVIFSQMRRINIFGKSTAVVTPEEEARKAADEAEDQITILSPEQFETLSVSEKRTYLDILELRGLPKPDRHLYWEKRGDTFAYYPLPDHPSKAKDEDATSNSGSSYSSYSTYSASQSAQEISPAKSFRHRQSRKAVMDLGNNHQIKLLQHIQAQKRKKFMEESIVSAHGVRVLPTYLKRPNSSPHFRSIEDQMLEEQEIYHSAPPSPNCRGQHPSPENLGSESKSVKKTEPSKRQEDYLDNDDYSLES